MRLILLLFTGFSLPSLANSTGETCNILNHFIPNRVLRPDWPKNDVCRYRESPHCCTRSVEMVMKGYANTYAHTLFFGHLMQMRDLTSDLFYRMQSMQLPYMSASLRETALEYKLLDNLSTKRETLITQATLDYLNIYYNVDHMPKFCKTGIVRDMESSISSFLQELVFSHDLVQSNWNVAKDLFAVVFSSQFTPHCITELIRSGMTNISCKTCTDHTVKIPTCFNYCTEVVTSCLEPYQPIVQLINQWFNLHVQVQVRITKYIHLDRFLRLKDKLNILVGKAFEDSHYSDVCEYHFKDRVSTVNNEYNIADRSQGRRRRLAKTTPPTPFYSSRPISRSFPSPTTSVTPKLELPTVAGNQLFDPEMICFNATATRTTTNAGCWNGTGIGEYDRSRIPTTESTPSNMFDHHLSRLKSKMNDLEVSLNRELVIVEPEYNNVEPTMVAQKPNNFGHGPNFNTVTILIIVMTWITLIV